MNTSYATLFESSMNKVYTTFIENQKRQIDLANKLIEYANNDLVVGLAKKMVKSCEKVISIEQNLSKMNTIEDLKKQMRNGVVEFSYKKKDGSTRLAKGTLNFDVMGEENQPKTGVDYDSNDTTRYFDVDSNGWRSFKNDNFIEIILDNESKQM